LRFGIQAGKNNRWDEETPRYALNAGMGSQKEAGGGNRRQCGVKTITLFYKCDRKTAGIFSTGAKNSFALRAFLH
jgi:hypothetical protein